MNKKAAKEGKKKRKRKVKLPKNYNPNVKPDAERWLPRWQRSNYKKKKNDRKFNVGKGTQGSTAVSAATESTSAQSPRPIGNSPAPNLTRQQRIQKKKGKKKGKR